MTKRIFPLLLKEFQKLANNVRQNCKKDFTHSMQFDEIFGENDRSGQNKFCMNCKMVCQNDKYALLKTIIIVKNAE